MADDLFFRRFNRDDRVAMAVRQQGLGAIWPMLQENPSMINEIHPNGYGLLHIAVYDGSINVVELLLDEGADVNLLNHRNESALHLAAERDFQDIAKILLQHGADINRRSFTGNTVLHGAVNARNTSLFNFLLDNGADVRATNVKGNSVLEEVVRVKSIDMLEMIFKPGVQVDLGLSDAETGKLMCTAVDSSKKDIVEFLWNRGFNFIEMNYKGETALHVATREGFEEIVVLLLDRGASVEVIDSSGNTLLHCAAVSGITNLFKLLMNYATIDVNAMNNRGETAMTHAINGAYDEIIRILLDSGAQVVFEKTSLVNYMNSGGSAEVFRLLLSSASDWDRRVADLALSVACVKNREEIVKILLERGARVNGNIRAGQTLLNVAAKFGRANIVKILLDSGANVHTRNEKKMTALHEACGNGFWGSAKVLVDYGAEINAENENNETPLMLAMEYGSSELVKGLRENNIFGIDCREYFSVVKMLLRHGAVICGDFMHRVITNQSDYEREFMHDDWFGRLSGPKDIIELFLEHGIDVGEIDFNNKLTTLSLAVKNKCEVAVQLLLDYGADVNVDVGIMRYGTTIKCNEIIIRHIVKMQNENLTVSQNILRDIDGNDRLRARGLKARCESEIESMKEDDSEVPFWGILISNHSDSGLAKFARNEEIVRVLRSDECRDKYPIYSNVLKNQLRRGIWWNLLLSKVQYFFHALAEVEGNENVPKLPKYCVDEIFSYFSKRDLRNLIRVCDPCGTFDVDLCDIELEL